MFKMKGLDWKLDDSFIYLTNMFSMSVMLVINRVWYGDMMLTKSA